MARVPLPPIPPMTIGPFNLSFAMVIFGKDKKEGRPFFRPFRFPYLSLSYLPKAMGIWP
jgi:hypothetical protein